MSQFDAVSILSSSFANCPDERDAHHRNYPEDSNQPTKRFWIGEREPDSCEECRQNHQNEISKRNTQVRMLLHPLHAADSKLIARFPQGSDRDLSKACVDGRRKKPV